MKFNDLVLEDKTKKALQEIGFDDMMPIQEQTIVPILEGKDVVGQAQTGTGKTAAFVIPILEQLKNSNHKAEHLIMAPTRELALQIVDEFRKIGRYHKMQVAAIVGGMDIRKQREALAKNPEIIVATPGRLIDHLGRKRIDLSTLKTFVIDEVDEMFKSGFKEEIDEIIKHLPEVKQTLLFSATISDNVRKVVKETCTDPVYVSVSAGFQTTKNIEQTCIVLKEKEKFATLLKLIEVEKPELAIIFGRTKRRADELGEALNKCGYRASAIHGDLTQGQRNAVMKSFKDGSIQILVATDVAARGIDVNGITHVYNFDLPQEVEFYVHRIGRTGRAGKVGKSITFARDNEIEHVNRIAKETKSDIEIVKAPSNDDVRLANRIQAVAEFNRLVKKTNYSKNKELIDALLETHSSEELMSVVVDIVTATNNHHEISLTGEPPVRIKLSKGGSRYSNRRSNGGDRNRSRSNDRSGGNRSSGGDRNRSRSNDRSKRSDSGNRRPSSDRSYRPKKSV